MNCLYSVETISLPRTIPQVFENNSVSAEGAEEPFSVQRDTGRSNIASNMSLAFVRRLAGRRVTPQAAVKALSHRNLNFVPDKSVRAHLSECVHDWFRLPLSS